MRRNDCSGGCFHAMDCGPEPLIANMNRLSNQNPYYRTALWTGEYLQVTLMSIPVHGEVGIEMHSDLDQLIQIEEGCALVMMGEHETQFSKKQRIDRNYAAIIPAGTWHNIVNVGNCPLKLYSVYAPAEHPFGTVHKTKADAEKEEYAGD